MLKLQYTDSGLFIERISGSIEGFVAQRATLALRAGQPLHVQPGWASFLLPADIAGLAHLEQALQQDGNQSTSIAAVDAEFVEVSLQGVWIAEQLDAEVGTFISDIVGQAEFLAYKLWQATQSQVSYLS